MTNKVYTVSYNSGGGVDFTSQTNARGREHFSHLENMWRDYETTGGEILESIPGFRKLGEVEGRINALYLQKDYFDEEFVLVHAKNKLYRFNIRDRDNFGALFPLTDLQDTKSCGFQHGNYFYILDGQKITRVDRDGNTAYVMDGSVASPYVPIAYKNGEMFEQRNLLTDRFFEESFILHPEDVFAATKELKYKISDTEKKYVSVSGVSSDFEGTLRIPSSIKIGADMYAVTEIGEYAFSENTAITSVIIADGVLKIGSFAFSNCQALTKAELPDTVNEIKDGAFSNCSSLSNLRLGGALGKIGANSFEGCDELTNVKYALDMSAFSRIENIEALGSRSVTEGVSLTTMRARIPLYSKTRTVYELLINGESVSYMMDVEGEDVLAVIIPSIEKTKLIGATVRIGAYAVPNAYPEKSFGANFKPLEDEFCTAFNAICKCRVAECFDGRIFLSGNPQYPNTVFYSSRDITGNNNPLYFGILNYWNDGMGTFPVVSMLATADSLAVFKKGDDGGGSIYYHVPKSTGVDMIPKVYPVSYIHSGICALGETISFFDDPIFLSENGVCALAKAEINLARSIAVRSHNINPRLLAEKLENAVMAKWCGYLFITISGRAYLADSRALFRHSSGNTEYEWYYLDGIGIYRNDHNVYRYASIAHDGYFVHKNADEVFDGEISSVVLNNGDTVYYSDDDGKRYELYKTEEKTGGTFKYATRLLSTDDGLLFFGTAGGDICVFNNDKRSSAPPTLSSDPTFSLESYKAEMGQKIHPYYYSFADHAPRYSLSTVYDDGSVPDMTKNSVKSSLTLKLETSGNGELVCEVGTDKRGYRELASYTAAELDFSSLDFKSFAFLGESRLTLPISEKEKGWIEKQISLHSQSFRAPFGIYSIGYRFYIKGKIKKRKL